MQDNEDAPVTRADLHAMEERLVARLEASLVARLEASIVARLEERIEHVETALLTEFHKWASPLEMRIRTHSATLRALDLETEALSDRVTKLEGREQPPA